MTFPRQRNDFLIYLRRTTALRLRVREQRSQTKEDAPENQTPLHCGNCHIAAKLGI
jgi:hypothetical protein